MQWMQAALHIERRLQAAAGGAYSYWMYARNALYTAALHDMN